MPGVTKDLKCTLNSCVKVLASPFSPHIVGLKLIIALVLRTQLLNKVIILASTSQFEELPQNDY